MPMEEAYFADMKASQIADMKNAGGRFGGAIAASLFLREYVKVDKVCAAFGTLICFEVTFTLSNYSTHASMGNAPWLFSSSSLFHVL